MVEAHESHFQCQSDLVTLDASTPQHMTSIHSSLMRHNSGIYHVDPTRKLGEYLWQTH